jgi:signal peptidase
MADKIFKILAYIFYAAIAVVAIFLLSTKLPVAGGFKSFVVQSGSMEPAIQTGSVVVVKPARSTGSGQAAGYQVGDVITFGPVSKTKSPTTHRIVEVKADGSYLTRGDANNADDMSTVSRFEIIGKVLFSVPYVGYAVAAAQKPWGFGLIIVIPAVLIIYEEVRNIRKELAKRKDYKKRVEKREGNNLQADGKKTEEKI